jgi:hypothetical protein
MNNKKVLIDALKNLGSAKAPAVKKDVVVGSNNPMDAFMMKKGGSSMLSVKKSDIDGAGKGLFANNGFRKNQLIGLAHKDGQPVGNIGNMHNHSDNPNMYSVKQGNERYVYAKRDIQPGEELTTNYRLQPELEQPEDFMRKGGSAPRLPKKNNSKAYSRSIEATNRLFAQHPLFAKQKGKKRKIYDPNAKRYQDGGISSEEQMNDANSAMMKARLAYANEFGNPAAQRMIVAPDQPYDFGNGMYGTHYMASMDDYAVPQIQNVNGQLILGDFEPSSREAMRFDNPDDAQYFAEHYKDVSPAFMEMELNPEEIEQYAKGGYIVEDISVPELTQAQLGGLAKSAKNLARIANIGTIGTANTVAKTIAPVMMHPAKILTMGAGYDGLGPFTGSPLNFIPFYGKDLSKYVDNTAFRKFGDSLDYVKLTGQLDPSAGPLLRMGKSQIKTEGNWAEAGVPNESYPGVFGARFDTRVPGSNLGYKSLPRRNGVLITDAQGNLQPSIPISDPGLTFHRRLPFSNRYIPVDMEALRNDQFDPATMGGNLQSLIERYGYAALGAAGLGAMGYNTPQEYLDEYVTNPLMQGYKSVEELLVNPWKKQKGGQIPKAQLGKAVSAVSKVVKPSTIKAASTVVPEVTDLIKLSQFTNNFKPEAMNIKFPLGFEGDSGVVLLKPNTKNIEDNLWHFQATMDNPMEAGKAMMLANKMFPYPNPSILEPYSLSLDSYNMLLNMGRRKDWDMAYENDVPLNWLHTHSDLFKGLKTPSSTSLGYGLDKDTATEMVDRLNNMLSSKGLMDKAYLESVPGSINRIYLPNYKLTRKFQGGGLIPAAKTLAKFTPGNALRSTLYKGVNPASYNVKEKLTGFPAELYNTAVNNQSRPFRVGLSLAYAPERLENYLSTKKISPQEFAKMPDADKKSLFDTLAVANMEDVGRRRLDAWAVGLGQPQEYSTLEQIGDNKYRMVGTEYTPEFFSERMKDLQANSILKSNLSEEAKAKQLISLSEQHYDLTPSPYLGQNVFDHYQSVAAREGRPFPASYDEWTKLRRSQIDSYVGMDSSHKPWVQQRHVGLSTHNPDPSFKFSVFDNDKYGVMGGYRWDLAKNQEGIQWQSHDKWDLNPWEKRGYAYLNPDPLVKKYLTNTYFKPLQKVEALGLVGGKPFDIENNFLVDPYTFKTLKKWQNGGPTAFVSEEETYGEDPATAVPMNANSYFSNWYRNRQLPFEEIGSKSYERAMKQFLPAYNPESPLLQELNTSVPYEYTEMIEGDPNNLGELVYDDAGNPQKILLKQSLTQDPEELNATITHEERTRLWDKYRDKVLPAEQIIIQPNLKSFEEGWGNLKGADKKAAEEYYDYLTDPNQDNIQSLIFEVRQKKGLQPTQVITNEDINAWKSEAEQSGALDKNSPNYDPALYNLFKIAKDNAALKDLFNYIASTDESSEELQYAQTGGAISYELGDEVDAATMKQLKKLGYTFEKV